MASKYRQRVTVGHDANGKPISQWACGNSQDELNQRIAELINGSVEMQKKVSCPLWEEYSHKWFQAHKVHLRPNTAIKQEYFFNKHVKPMFQGKRINEISTFDVVEALSHHKSYVKSHGRDLISMMKNVFSSAVDDKIIPRDENPMNSKLVKNPCSKKSTPRKALSQKEQADIISHLADLKNPSDRRYMSFLMFTCLSPSEILGLRWEDLDLEAGFIHISRALTFAKGKGVIGEPKEELRERLIWLDPQLLEHIAPLQAEGFIICRIGRGHDGEHYTEQAQKRAWDRIKKQIDVHGMTAYIGRHTYATNMSKVNVPMKVAMTIMGHTDERMLMRHYVHTDEDDIKQAGALMSSFIGKVQSA